MPTKTEVHVIKIKRGPPTRGSGDFMWCVRLVTPTRSWILGEYPYTVHLSSLNEITELNALLRELSPLPVIWKRYEKAA